MITEKMKNIIFYLRNKIDIQMKEYDLTTVQILLLQYLYLNQDKIIIQKDLCDYLSLKHSTVIDILERLEKKELISKKTDYKALITITEKGKKLVESVGAKKGFIEDKLLDGFSKKDIELLNDYLERIDKNVKNNFLTGGCI